MNNIILNEKHLVERALERNGICQEKSKEHFRNLMKILKELIPEDWRFTVSPTAYFLISYQPEEKFDYRILGRSFRDKVDNSKNGGTLGKEIILGLRSPVLKRKELEALAKKYLELLNCCDCVIFHELKTILKKNAGISQEKNLQKTILGTIPQIVPLSEKRLANRPNAVILGEEIWVRQGEYLNPDSKPLKEYLVFHRLFKEGVDKSRVKIFSLDEQGNLKEYPSENFAGKENIKGTEAKKLWRLNDNLRSQSYWTLPTFVDALYWDLLYKKGHWVEVVSPDPEEEIGLNQRESFLLCRLENLLQLVRKLVP